MTDTANHRGSNCAQTSAVRTWQQATDDEWKWVVDRLTGRFEVPMAHPPWPTSYSLMKLVWKAVHIDDWSCSDVSEYRITLRRFHQIDRCEILVIWRDALGRYRSTDHFAQRRIDVSRKLAEAESWLP